MAEIEKPIRLVNPGIRTRRVNPGKKHLSWKQKLHFGSKRQRAAAKARLSNSGKEYGGRRGGNRKMIRSKKSGSFAKQDYYHSKHVKRRRDWKKRSDPRRLPNVGEIITIHPLSNSGTSRKRRKNKGVSNNKTMAKKNPSRKRHLAGLKAARTRKRRHGASGTRKHHRRRNPGITKTVVRYRNRGKALTNRRHRRRNPGIMSGGGGEFLKVAGAIGGALVTSTVMSMVPAQFGSGIIGYVATAIVATLQGTAAGKILKNEALGSAMRTGGFVYLALKIAKDYFPGLNLGLSLSGIRGMGLIGGSSFYVPQVPLPGQMGNFVAPYGLTSAIGAGMMATPKAMNGLGTMRRVGRMR